VGTDFEEVIIEALNNAKAVIVLWSEHSANSEWVNKEVQIALQQKKLKPVLLDDTPVPAVFGRLDTALLSSWNGENDHPELVSLYSGITDSVLPSRLDNVRKGYDPFFLGDDKMMLPEVKGTADLIHYANFSIVMNPTRRMAWYVAYNIDGTAYREGLPRNDHWMPDPLWPKSLQPSNQHFVNSGWNRGHLLSPGTVCWGDVRIAGIARRQANYWTNTTPQSGNMNIRWWLAVENFERSAAMKRGKAIGFSGPVFSEEDKVFRDEFEKDGMFIAKETYRIPRAYWKVVIVKDGAVGQYAAFILDQMELEEKRGAAFKITDHLVTLETLEKATGLVFYPPFHVLKMMSKKEVEELARNV